MHLAFHSNGSHVLNRLKKTNYSIVDLLSQNNYALVHDSKMIFEILKTLHKIINLLIDCLDRFYVAKQYQYFDPHVGENACQIRAYFFVVLSKNGCDINVLTERIHFLNVILDKLAQILNEKISYKNNSFTIVELIKKYQCYFSIEWDECFLFRSYFLTLFKKTTIKKTYICKDKIAHFLTTSKRLSERMIDTYQSQLALMSCDFIKIIASQLNINEKNSPSMLSSMRSDNAGRMVYPCFLSSKIIFMHMQKTRCSVLIILENVISNDRRKDIILFDKGNNHGYFLTKNNNLTKEDVCVVLTCSRIASLSLSSQELLKKLNYFGLYDMLLMNVSAHAQFSGSKLVPFSEQFIPDTSNLMEAEKKIEAEFLSFKKSAHENGFSTTNPSMLLIKHIFMDTIKNQMNLHQNTKDISVREPVDI